MTSLADRPNTALVVANAYNRDEVIAHANTYWTWQEGPGRTASVVEAAAVDFGA